MPSPTVSRRRRQPTVDAPEEVEADPPAAPVGRLCPDPHVRPDRTIDAIIADLMEKQTRLSALLDEIDDPDEVVRAARLFALYGQNASRLGRLLRDKRALSGDAADGLLDALGKALDEISTEVGIKL